MSDIVLKKSDVVYKNALYTLAYEERRYKRAFARRAMAQVIIALLIILICVLIPVAAVVRFG